MATVKALSSALCVGIKCLNRRVASDILGRRFQVRCNALVQVPARFSHSKYEYEYEVDTTAPVVGDDSLYTGFEISRNPDEWKAVERLLPAPVIKEPTPKAEYPSGWTPQNPPEDSPYFVKRTSAHMMPVYLKFKGVREHIKKTQVRRVLGDIWQLERELRAYLQEQYPKELSLVSKVDEVAGVIQFNGDHVNYIKRYLSDRGW